MKKEEKDEEGKNMTRRRRRVEGQVRRWRRDRSKRRRL
jgi:hypothetical protein